MSMQLYLLKVQIGICPVIVVWCVKLHSQRSPIWLTNWCSVILNFCYSKEFSRYRFFVCPIMTSFVHFQWHAWVIFIVSHFACFSNNISWDNLLTLIFCRFSRGQNWGAARALLEQERQQQLHDQQHRSRQEEARKPGGIADALLGMTSMAVTPYVRS